MEKGADIKGVFSRLSRGAAHIESQCKFMHNDHLGYITACPTNCGTGMRASVHLKLPKLGKDKTKFKAIADKFYVQIRNTGGEIDKVDKGIYDISNKRRLGRSEVELVQDMYDGVKEMIKTEMSM